MNNKPFQIYKLATLLDTPGANVNFERQQEQAWQLILFLRMHNLISDDSLPRKKEEVNRDFKLMSDNVNEEGLAVLREGFHKWLDKNDNISLNTFNMVPLEKAFAKVKNRS